MIRGRLACVLNKELFSGFHLEASQESPQKNLEGKIFGRSLAIGTLKLRPSVTSSLARDLGVLDNWDSDVVGPDSGFSDVL